MNRLVYMYMYTRNWKSRGVIIYELYYACDIISVIMDPNTPKPYGPDPSGMYPNHPPTTPPPGQYQAASQTRRSHGKLWLVISIVLGVLLLATIGFAVWAYMERQEYKNNVEGIVSTEVEQAVDETTLALEQEFVEREKEPLTNYTSPAAYGSVSIDYPKTWSAYIKEESSNSTPIEGYFHPRFVPDEDGDELIALTLEVRNTEYDRVLQSYDSAARSGKVTVSPIEAKNINGVVGSRIDGEISRDIQGSVVLFQLRDKTLVLTTESTEFKEDFNSIILENFSFAP